ncbi:MAG: cupin domain-containing protein [Spirochaetes bacterium]|nr:cupin domain-containing protein [Spirochaetota bacterium]
MCPVDLEDHLEGGRFLEVFRSGTIVSKQDGTERPAMTHIYFSLNPGEVSNFHKVSSDEVWNLYQGEGVKLHIWDGRNTKPYSVTLSAENNCFCHVIPAGVWQAAEPVSDKVLVGCSVAPGFDFADFTLMNQGSEEAEKVILLSPDMRKYIAS